MVPLFAEDQKARQMERQVRYKHPTWKKSLTMAGTGHTTVLPTCLPDGLEKKVNSAYKPCSPSTWSLTLFSWLEATNIAPPSTSPIGWNANPGIFFAGTHHPGEGRQSGVKFFV